MARIELRIEEHLVDDVEPIHSGEPSDGGAKAPTKPPADGVVAEFDEVEGIQRDAMLLEYATAWFVYHAGQRIQSFNFFILIQGALIAASLGMFAHRGDAVGFVAVTFIGILLVLPFLVLEIRNAELVENGRHTLDKLEERLMTGTPELLRSDLPVYRDTHRLDADGRIPQLMPFHTRFHTGVKPQPVVPDDADKRYQKDAPWAKYLKHTLMLRSMYLAAEAAWILLFAFAVVRLCAA